MTVSQNNGHVYEWRCAKCTNHFASINKVEGSFIIEKKCSKCKAVNKLHLSKQGINIECKFAFEDEVYSQTESNQNFV